MKFDWKVHLALLPAYIMVLGVVGMLCIVAYCAAIQFGFWGPIAAAFVLWFVGGLGYFLARV